MDSSLSRHASLIGTAALMLAPAPAALAYSREKLVRKAKISIEKARGFCSSRCSPPYGFRQGVTNRPPFLGGRAETATGG
ncbi:MAG: hypothetical protein WA733_03395 [Methylocystis sp.]